MGKRRVVTIAVMLTVMVGMSFFVSLQAANAQVSNLRIDETSIMETSVSFEAAFAPNAVEKGVCWGTEPNPKIDTVCDTCYKSITDAGVGNYKGNITGLSPSTTYYVGVYANTREGGDMIYVYKSSTGTLATFKTDGPPPEEPKLTTATVTFNSATSVTTGGTVTHNGYANITERGIYWGTMANPGPDNEGTHVPDEEMEGDSFTLDIEELLPNTTYYVRAYATNDGGDTGSTFTGYGADVSFNTFPPAVETSAVSDDVIGQTSATVGGTASLTAIGAPITARGICWSESTIPDDPAEGDCTEIAAAEAGAGAFTVQIPGLAHSTEYHFRAYAENMMDRAYGADVAFTTFKPGDVNRDEAVDLKDGMLLLKMMVGASLGTEKIYLAADTNGDGKLGMADLLKIFDIVLNQGTIK